MNEKSKILSTVSIYHALNDGAISIIPILFPIFKDIFDLNYTQIGVITSGGILTTLIIQLLLGRYSDGRNSRTMLTLGVLLLSASMLLLTQSTGFLTLVFFIILLRMSASFFHPIGIGWLSRIFKKDRLDWAMGVNSGFADLGAFIAIATTLYITELTSWQFPLYVWSIAGAAIVLSGLYLTRDLKDEFLLVKKDKKKRKIKESLTEGISLLKNIKILIPAFMISGAAWGTITTYLPLLLDEKTTLPLSSIGLIIAIWLGVGSITSFYYGRINAWLGRKNVIILCYLTIGLMGMVLTFYVDIFVLIIVMILLGLTVFITFPALASFVSESTDEKDEGKTFGVIFTLQLGGGTIILLFGGIISDIFGIWSPFTLLGIVSLMLTALLLINYKKPYIQIKN